MELKDTVERMLSEDYKERLIAEWQQLEIRIEGLRDFLFEFDQGYLRENPPSKRLVYKNQLDAMLAYQEYLTQRIKDEKIPGFGCFGDTCAI